MPIEDVEMCDSVFTKERARDATMKSSSRMQVSSKYRLRTRTYFQRSPKIHHRKYEFKTNILHSPSTANTPVPSNEFNVDTVSGPKSSRLLSVSITEKS